MLLELWLLVLMLELLLELVLMLLELLLELVLMLLVDTLLDELLELDDKSSIDKMQRRSPVLGPGNCSSPV